MHVIAFQLVEQYLILISFLLLLGHMWCGIDHLRLKIYKIMGMLVEKIIYTQQGINYICKRVLLRINMFTSIMACFCVYAHGISSNRKRIRDMIKYKNITTKKTAAKPVFWLQVRMVLIVKVNFLFKSSTCILTCMERKEGRGRSNYLRETLRRAFDYLNVGNISGISTKGNN